MAIKKLQDEKDQTEAMRIEATSAKHPA